MGKFKRQNMTKDEVAKLIEQIPKELDVDDFLVALANKAIETKCCNHDCAEGRDCPLRGQNG